MVQSFEQTIIEVCRSHFNGIEAVYLFGSHAQKEAGPGSDLDVALLFDHQQTQALGDLSLSDAALELGRTLDRHVDMVNLRKVSTVFQYQVITTGKLLSAKDDSTPFVFEGLVVSLYQKLKEERSLIEQDIRLSGEIYTS